MKNSNLIFAQASPHSIGGKSLFDANVINKSNVNGFRSAKKTIAAAVRKLKAAGFKVFDANATTISIAGPKELYEKTFKTKLIKEKREVLGEQRKKKTVSYWDSPDTAMVGYVEPGKSNLSDVIEGVALARPATYFENAYAPTKSYWHLRVPGDVSLGINADKAHREGYTGKKIRVTMVDSGWYEHPYFKGRGYRYNPVVLGGGASAPTHDESGHGTAESANLFAVAPDIIFTMLKMGGDPTADLNKAVADTNPQIISCSWGYDIEFGPLDAYLLTLEAAVANAVAKGIIVVFSAGNGHWGFPGQHPDVISAGGTYMTIDGKLRASDYSSGFKSNIYSARIVPDVCGLVGMKPKAAYIMLPVEPNDQIDVLLAGGTHPNGDETTNKDGWAAISGTSAAAPQIAGVCALMKQKKASLTPALAKKILKATAIDVKTGNCNSNTGGHAAVAGPDLATGKGLVNAYKAVSTT